MGHEVQGGVVLDAGALAAPCNVTLVFGEELQPNRSVLSPMRTGSLYRDSWALAPTSGAATARAQHHEYITGRYGELGFECAAASATADIAKKSSRAAAVATPRVRMWVVRARDMGTAAASMSSSSPELNAVWSFCQYTSRATSLDLFSDSNARQRSVDCMADDHTAMRLAYATSAELGLQRYAMLQALTVCGSLAPAAAATQATARVDGAPLIMARDDAHGRPSFSRHTTAVVGAGGRIDAHVGLVDSDQVLIDWPPNERDRYVLSRYNSVANAFAYRGLRTLVEIAIWLGRHADAARHAEQAAALKTAINAQMWNGTAFCDGVCSNVSHTAFHSTMYLLAFGAVDESHRAAAWRYLRGRIEPPLVVHRRRHRRRRLRLRRRTRRRQPPRRPRRRRLRPPTRASGCRAAATRRSLRSRPSTWATPPTTVRRRCKSSPPMRSTRGGT